MVAQYKPDREFVTGRNYNSGAEGKGWIIKQEILAQPKFEKSHTCKSGGSCCVGDQFDGIVFNETKGTECGRRPGPGSARLAAVSGAVGDPTAGPTLSVPQTYVVFLAQTRVF